MSIFDDPGMNAELSTDSGSSSASSAASNPPPPSPNTISDFDVDGSSGRKELDEELIGQRWAAVRICGKTMGPSQVKLALGIMLAAVVLLLIIVIAGGGGGGQTPALQPVNMRNDASYAGAAGTSCADAKAGDACYTTIQNARSNYKFHPNWYGGLTPDDSDAQWQYNFMNLGMKTCAMPCSFHPPTPMTEHMPCHTATAADKAAPGALNNASCYAHVNWSMTTGFKEHPYWYPQLTNKVRWPA